MKIGDYVRTDTGIIEKLEGIHKQNKTNETIIKLNRMGGGRYAHILDINSQFADDFDKNFSRGNIIKSSPNIIDLIEVGDYVNGQRVNYINKDREHFNISFGNEDFNLKSKFNSDIYWLSKEDIKSIVTKEQFKAMEYKVESEVN